MKKKLSTRIFSIFLSLLMVVSILPAGVITAQAADSRIESAINWAVSIANNNYYGYSQAVSRRNGTPDFDCSSLVSWAFHNTGFNVQGGLNTRTMRQAFVNAGFTWIPASQISGFPAKSTYLQRGDILLYEEKHTEIYIGNGQNVGAHADYNGIPGGNGGGRSWSSGWKKYRYGADEIDVGPYWNDNWQGVLRYTKNTPPPPPAIPDKPTITGISSENIAVGKSVTIYWNASSRATSYNVAIRGAETRDIALNSSARSCTFTLNNVGSHSIYVEAKNQSGTSPNNNYRVCTTHNPSKVTFVDWDGTELGVKGGQSVRYGESATAPTPPEREGYTFQGWQGSYQNVTSNQVVKATYKINTYTVKFLDKEGKLLKSEKVEYGKDAIPPTDTNTPTGYNFLGWDSENYKNVFTRESDKTIMVNGIYQWFNDDLQIVCNNVTATRQSDGYYVYFDLTNGPKAITRGRAVVSLKTATGKLVDTTESAAFSIPKNGTKTGMEVFIPCELAATNVEIIVVDSYSSGVPISEKVTEKIDQGLKWSEWSIQKPDETNPDIAVESRTEYRSRDKEFSTGNTKTKSGWTYTGNRTEQVGGWSGWGWNWIDSYDNESQRREVQTQSAISSYNYKTVWNYYRWSKQYSGGTSSPSQSNSFPNYYEYSFDSELGLYSSGKYKWWYNGSNYCVLYPRSPYTSQVKTSANYGTQYRYRDINYVYSFYRWKDWNDWSPNEVSANSNREVETRTTYRFKSTSAGIENDEGKEYTISNKLDSSFAGNQITLYVYGYTGASDYTNEYIGQSVVADDGSYSFTFKLREEPTVKTGDFTVAIGIEGTTNRIEIDTIKAPKPTYEVKFYDWDGTVINTQTVTEGEDAVLPENPTKEGYDFLGWDKSVANITEDTEFFADFKKQEFTVVFVDWENQLIKVEKFEYGDVLTTPDFSEVEGYTFDGWDQIKKGHSTVTQDMVVSANYEINTYTVKFYDFDGNVISTQEVDYGSEANAPSLDSSDGKQFAGWFNPEEYQNVSHDVSIYPSYYFEETTDIPIVNYESGEYTQNLQLTLTSSDENAVIYYYINDDESNEQIYTKPISVNKTCSITYYATSFGKNDSEIETNYYCINTAGNPSEWMLYDDLPTEVIENLNDYVLDESEGYRYKDIQNVSRITDADKLEKSDWTLIGEEYTDYTSWQDEEITDNDSIIGFEVDTQEVPDKTVSRYQYSHYKYVDSNGEVKYSPVNIDEFDCIYETIISDNKHSIAGFDDTSGTRTAYYDDLGDNQLWFNQSRIDGVKTQYRSRYKIASYYKWSDWTVDTPTSSDNREYQNDLLYRYDNKDYHIVTVETGFGDLPLSKLVQSGKIYDTSELNVDGYTLEGLYTDSELKNKININSPITESIMLYAKYNPNVYNVIFQMEDGTELDYQRIEYLQSAIAPDTDVVPGYIFGGWDKEFDCITEDTVIIGKYFKDSEYARISLNYEKAEMYQGSSIILVPTITPSNLTDEVIEWTSSDPSIASVDDNGKVTAVGAGTATITAKVVTTKETATCTINVTADKNNFIILKSDSSLNYDSLGYLRRIALKTTIETASKEFTNDNLKFFNINGNELKSSDYIGTGTQVKLFNGSNAVDTKTVVVTGDMTGDGIINNRDVAMMNKKLIDKADAQECQMLAIDVNGDGYVNNKDAAMVARYLVGKDVF